MVHQQEARKISPANPYHQILQEVKIQEPDLHLARLLSPKHIIPQKITNHNVWIDTLSSYTFK